MNKRNLAAFLWFFGGWTLGSALAFFAGLPWALGPTVALLLAAVVWWDPTHQLWPARQPGGRSARTTDRLAGRQIIRPMNEVADELDRKAQLPSAVAADPAAR
ncbi:MAG TPA: hypothetical protein VGQ85_04145 [Candidatus Limnocylindrales bacterium]|nr:hypothetical protein [Candidatus Limnocylindrales bacterium]